MTYLNRLATFVVRAPEDPPGGQPAADQTQPDPAQQQQAAIEPPAQQQQVAPATPVVDPAAVRQFLESAGLAVVPREAVERQQQEAAQRMQAERQQIDAAEKQRLAELQHSDPEAYQELLDKRTQRITQEQVQAATHEMIQAPALVQDIVRELREKVPNLPQKDLDEIVAEMTKPGVSTANLQAAKANGYILNYAKGKAFDAGVSAISPSNQRPPNTPASTPGTQSTKTDPRADRAAMLAKSLGVPVESITGSNYY